MLFRRTNRYGYSRYYGGGGPAWILRILVTLAVIIALVVGGVTWSMQKYMVYTAEGGHLEFPWNKPNLEKPGEGMPDPEQDLVVDLPDSSEEGDTSASVSGDVSLPGDGSASESGDVTPPADESQPGDASASQGDASQPDQSVQPEESQPAQPTEETKKPGMLGGLAAWFSNLFSSQPATTEPPQDTSDVSSSVEPEGETSAPGDDSAEGDTSTTAPVDQPKPEEKPVKRPDPLREGILVQHVSMGDFGSGYARGDVQDAGGNGLMLFMKESGGRLNYPTELELADELDARSDSSAINRLKETLEDLKSDGLYTIAYVDCFQDANAEGLDGDVLLDSDGDPWYDGDDRCWADPASETYQQYLLGIVEELTELGYDEIVLRNAGYPVNGDLDNINEEQYQAEQMAKTLKSFYGKLAKAMKGKKTLLSVVTSSKTIYDGADADMGHNLDDLRQLGGRLWVEADADEVDELNKRLEKANFPENALGVLTDDLNNEYDWCQMNVD